MSKAGKVVTFYSYKGGTGRTMALANTAVTLARQGKGRVLMIDWDLEAPGLHDFFPELAVPRESTPKTRPGVLELFEYAEDALPPPPAPGGADEDHIPWEESVSPWEGADFSRFICTTAESPLDLMPAGNFDDSYGRRVSGFPWQALFERCPTLFKSLADKLAETYSYVLIDSRTGFTDSSGICTMLLPDHLVVVFTPNQQSLNGVIDLTRRATAYRRESVDLRPLLVFPLASRVEASEEELRHEWRHGGRTTRGYQPEFERLFEDVYDLPHCRLDHYFDEIQVQHVPRYAYGEQIAARDEHSDRLSLSRSYERFTKALVDANSPWAFEGEDRPSALDDLRQALLFEKMSATQQEHERVASALRTRNTVLLLAEAAFAILPIVIAIGILLNGSATSETPSLSDDILPLIIGGAILVGVLESFRRRLAFDKHRAVHARAANAIGRERTLFDSGAGPYTGVDDPSALLTERYEEIRMHTEDALLGQRSFTSIGHFDSREKREFP